jgi:HK97 family phage prohead protease
LKHFDLVGLAAPFRSETAAIRGATTEQFWPGAFARACADSWNEVRIDHGAVIANGDWRAVHLIECSLGLLVAVRVADRSQAGALKQAAAAGAFVGCSVSMDGSDTTARYHCGVRTITDTTVLEVSLISRKNRPAYADTWVMSADGDDWFDRLWADFVRNNEAIRCYAFSNMTRQQRAAQLMHEQSPAGARYRAAVAKEQRTRARVAEQLARAGSLTALSSR